MITIFKSKKDIPQDSENVWQSIPEFCVWIIMIIRKMSKK